MGWLEKDVKDDFDRVFDLDNDGKLDWYEEDLQIQYLHREARGEDPTVDMWRLHPKDEEKSGSTDYNSTDCSSSTSYSNSTNFSSSNTNSDFREVCLEAWLLLFVMFVVFLLLID